MDPYTFALSVVNEAAIMLRNARTRPVDVGIKEGNHKDIVTSVDYDIHQFLTAKIRDTFSDHAIHSEEGEEAEEKEYMWVIDPIDGSANFSRNLPHFAICLGLMEKGVPILGAILNPLTGELFSFKKGAGAFLNGDPIHVSNTTEIKDAFVFLHAGRRDDVVEWGGESYKKLLRTVRKTGNWSSSSLDLCFLASGRLDAVIYGTLTALDIASAIGLLEEAGGVFSDGEGNPIRYTKESQRVYAANSHAMLGSIRGMLETS